ncbi:bone morphogenetic protein receptor type-2-like [Heterodontus francisci]|uniref:bone morphogenetic protein receptor type-2-like n=1 Tax=Heterodontus francisci TaxID=7792 RepID=UPI00355B1045
MLLVAFVQMDLLPLLSVLIWMVLLQHSEDGSGEGRVCKSFQKSDNQSNGPSNGTVTCGNSDYCFGIWRQGSDGAFHPDKQGCWPPNNVLSCNSTCADKSRKSHPFYSCCCNSDLCNADPPIISKVLQVPTHGLLTGILCLIVILVISTLLGLLCMDPGGIEPYSECDDTRGQASTWGPHTGR